MYKNVFGVLSIILLLFLVCFGPYVYYYANSKRVLNLTKDQCVCINPNLTNRPTYYWDESDNKCYKGIYTGRGVCEADRDDINRVQPWQKSVLISASVIMILSALLYAFLPL